MNKKELSKYNSATEFLLYKTAHGDIKVDVLLQNETIWIPQKKLQNFLMSMFLQYQNI